MRVSNLADLEFDLSRSLKSNVKVSLDASYMVSYYCLIVTYGLN